MRRKSVAVSTASLTLVSTVVYSLWRSWTCSVC